MAGSLRQHSVLKTSDLINDGPRLFRGDSSVFTDITTRRKHGTSKPEHAAG